MGDPFVYANPGERRNQSKPGWDQAPLTLAQFERIIPPVFNMSTAHRQQAESVPGRTPGLPSLTPAPADHVLEREPASFSHLRQGYGGQARGGEG